MRYENSHQPPCSMRNQLLFLYRLQWPPTRLADVADMYQRSVAAIDRAMQLLETQNPPVLILHEATSAVDNETEAAFQRSDLKIGKRIA